MSELAFNLSPEKLKEIRERIAKLKAEGKIPKDFTSPVAVPLPITTNNVVQATKDAANKISAKEAARRRGQITSGPKLQPPNLQPPEIRVPTREEMMTRGTIVRSKMSTPLQVNGKKKPKLLRTLPGGIKIYDTMAPAVVRALEARSKRAGAAIAQSSVSQEKQSKKEAVQEGGRWTPSPPYSPMQERVRILVLQRDWGKLFQEFPYDLWLHVPLNKWSFRIKDGKREYVPFTYNELKDFYENHHRTKEGWNCKPSQTAEFLARAWRNQRARTAGHPKTSQKYAEFVYPAAYCEEPDESFKDKAVDVLKKAAVVGAVATGAVFLGPAVVGAAGKGLATVGGAIKGAAGAVATGAGKIFGGGAAQAATTEAAKEAAQGTLLSNASSAIPKIVEQVNNARMIKAIVEGKVPPPPISLQGDNFTEWAMNAAKQELAERQQEKITQAQERELRLMIQGLQNEMVKQVPPDYPMQPMPQVPTQVQAQQAAVKERNQLTQTILAAAIPTAGFLLFK